MSVNALGTLDNAGKRSSVPVNLIFAQDMEGGIGYDGTLPWENRPYKRDMRMFRELTSGPTGSKNAVIMGYRTWLSIPVRFRPLKSRTNIVMTSTHREELLAEGSVHFAFDSWGGVTDHLETAPYDSVWVIGGAEVYCSAIANVRVDKIYRTTFKERFRCDKFIDIEGILDREGLSFLTETMYEDDESKVDILTVTGRKEGCQ